MSDRRGCPLFCHGADSGKTIADFLKGSKPIFEEKEATEIILQIAQALEHAARRSLVHRDIKPSNIMLTAEGVAKLADLGLAREATDQETIERERGLTIGTPFYIAPEQIKGKDDIDSRADIYSLGATFYHMVTGRPLSKAPMYMKSSKSTSGNRLPRPITLTTNSPPGWAR